MLRDPGGARRASGSLNRHRDRTVATDLYPVTCTKWRRPVFQGLRLSGFAGTCVLVHLLGHAANLQPTPSFLFVGADRVQSWGLAPVHISVIPEGPNRSYGPFDHIA